MFVKNFNDISFINLNLRLWQHVEIQTRVSEQWIPMNVDAAAGGVVKHKVEVKIEMSMKAIMMILRMKMIQRITTNQIVTWVPVVTKMTGMMMIQIMTVETGVWTQAEISRTRMSMKMIMKIMMIQEIGKAREEIKVVVMVIRKKMIMVIHVVLIQEEDLEAWVVEWDRVMAIVQIPEEVLVRAMEMKADAGNPQEDIVVILVATGKAVLAIGEAEVVKVAVAGWDQVIQEMAADVDSQDTEIVQAAIGEVEARVAVAVIPVINISEEDNPGVMIIINLEEAVEMEAVTVHAGEEAVPVLLQAGAADAAAIDNSFSKNNH